MVVLAIVGVGFAGKYIMGQLRERDAAVVPNPAASYTPVRCAPTNVDTSMELAGTRAGSAVTFTVTLKNLSESNPCYIDVGWGNMDVNITSGDAQVASVAACEPGKQSTLLLLDRGMETTRTLTWNGGVGEGCVSPSVNASQPGTYLAELRFGDSSAKFVQQTFVLYGPEGQPPAETEQPAVESEVPPA